MNLKRLCFLTLALTAAAAGAQDVPRSQHVWMITEENHSYEEVVGNASMPYYNQLIARYGLATQFYANQHSSLPALMWFVAGAAVELDNDTVSCQHTQDNVVRELLKKGYSWRSYQENMPSAGYQGLFGGDGGSYYRRHNPLIDFSDVCPGSGQENNSVPYAQMDADFAQGETVNYAYITPDADEDAHNGTVEAADQWLEAHVPEILARPEFAPGGDGILFIVWDESNAGDGRCSASVASGCGGRTATLVIGPRVRQGFQSTTAYRNENVLKTVCAAMGLSPCPGAAQDAAPMSEFFAADSSSAPPSNSVVISTPGSGATVQGAVHLQAVASEDQPVSQTQIWDNGRKLGVQGTQIDETYALTPGNHTTSVVDLDASYKVLHRASVSYTVQAPENGLQVISPSPNETVKLATVHIVARATEAVPISQVQVWDNGTKLGWYAGAEVNQYFSLAPGSHTVTVLDLDSGYNVLHQSSVSYSVE